jgi:hypothetical protein
MAFRFWPKRFVDDERSNLGNVLLKMGAVTEAELDFAVELQKKRQDALLGELLVETGALTKEKLEQALDYQKDFRNGNAADAMLRIVEGRTERAHSSVQQLVHQMAVVIPVIMTAMVGTGYVVFDEDLKVVSAMEGPLAVAHGSHEPPPERFVGQPVSSLLSAWMGNDEAGEPQAVERFMAFFRDALAGEGTEMFLAIHGKRMRLEWVPIEEEGRIVGGVVVAQTPDPLLKAFRTHGA